MRFKLAEWFFYDLYCNKSDTLKLAGHMDFDELDFGDILDDELIKKHRLWLPCDFLILQDKSVESIEDREAILISFLVVDKMVEILSMRKDIEKDRKKIDILVSFKLKSINSNFSNIKNIKLYRHFPNQWTSDRISSPLITFYIGAEYSIFDGVSFNIKNEIKPPKQLLKYGDRVKAFYVLKAGEECDKDELKKILNRKTTKQEVANFLESKDSESELYLWIFGV